MNHMKYLRDNAAAILASLCEIVVGVLLLVDPVRFTSGIIIALGVLLAVFGVLGIVKYFRMPPMTASKEQRLSKGLVLLLLGLFCVIRSDWFIATFPVLTMLYGVGVLIAGLAKVQWTVDFLRMKRDFWWVAAISAAVSIACAAIIIANPFSSTLVLWIFIGVTLLAEAVCDLLAIFLRKKTAKEPPAA